MDLVKHALKTVVLTMRPIDRLGLVLFNETTSIAFGFTEMTEEGQTLAQNIINKIIPSGGTNIYKGL